MQGATDDDLLARFTLDSVAEEIYWTDSGGRFIYVNDAACKALGYSRAELLEKTVPDIAPGFTPEGWRSHWLRLRAERTLRFEAEQETRTGTRRTVEITTHFMEWQGREYSCAFARDISLRKRIEAEARERERWLDDSQKAGGVGSYHFDLVSDHWKCTPTMEAIFGIDPGYPKTLEGWTRLIAPEQQDAMATYFKSIYASGAVFDREYRIVRPCDGQSRWVHGRGEFLRNADGGIVSLIGTIMDVTERRRAQEVLRQSEEKFARAFANAPMMMAITAVEDGRYLEVNRTFCESLGFEPGEVIGKSSVELGLIPAEARVRVREELRRSGRIDRLELPVLLKDGRRLDCIFGGELIEVEGQIRLLSTAIDVTERRRAQEVLRQSEAKFATVFNQAPLLITISSLETGHYLDVNRKFCEVSGFSREEALGKSSIELGWITPDARGRLLEAFRRDGRVSDLELALTAKDGREVLCLFNGELISVDGRQMLLSISLDITDRKHAEAALRESEARFALFMEHLPAAAFIKDPDGATLMANRYLKQLVGGTEMVNRTTAELFPPEVAAKMIADDRKALAAGLTVVEETVRDTGGNARHFQTIKFPVPIDGGKTVLGGVAVEITERKRAEEALRAQERILRSVIDASPDSLFLLALDGTVLLANQAFLDRMGRRLDEMVGHNVLDFLPPERARQRIAMMERVAATREPLVFEDNRDGRTLENRIYPVFGPTGAVEQVAVLSIDITEKLRMQDQLNRTQKLESLGVLAGGIAHDFNNILTAILGNLSFARRMIGADHRAAPRLAECEKATVRAGELTQQLLTFARGGAPVRRTVDTGALLDEVLQFALRGSNVKGTLDLAPELWCLDADEGQLGQLFNNLLINAKQSMPGGGDVTVRAINETVACPPGTGLAPGRYVSISVRDEGIGIPPEHVERIFDPYFTTKEGGSGLGLSSVHSIARRHGGDVAVSSVPGKGTEFVIRLPAAERREAAGGTFPETVPEALPAGHGRVLVMDDEEMLARLATMMLGEIGYEAEACADGAEAVARYRAALETRNPFAAVILDLTVPGGLGGKEAAARILAIDPDAVLIVSSGYSNDPVMADHAAYGFRGAVAKPYAIETLAAEMARLTGARPSG
jgi:PAS domain S-box-containing protein